MRILFLSMVWVALASAQLMNPASFPVINVAGVDITGSKIDSLAQQLAKQQFRGKQMPPQAMGQMKMLVVENLIAAELVKKEVLVKKIVAPKNRVDSLLKIMRAQAQTENAFNGHLKRMGMTLNQFKGKLGEQIQTEILLEKVAPYPKPSSAKEVKAYFDKNKSNLPKNDTVAGFQIYLNIEKGEASASTLEKKKLLEGFASQVRLGKADFRQLAARYSDEKGAQKTGGSMGRFGISSKGAAYAKAIKAIKVGDISPVFNTNKRLVLLMLMERNDGKFASYKYKIEYLLAVKKEEERMLSLKVFIESLVKKYGVKYYNDSYKPKQAIGANYLQQKQ
jgi:parvulin-like peptidyl-prolyl isomerase